MKKPEKIISGLSGTDYCSGFNHACDDWEKWLPSEEEIKKLISNILLTDKPVPTKTIAKEISKRIRG